MDVTSVKNGESSYTAKAVVAALGYGEHRTSDHSVSPRLIFCFQRSSEVIHLMSKTVNKSDESGRS